MPGVRWTDEEYAKYLAAHHRVAVPVADVERGVGDAAAAADAGEAVDSQFRIKFHSRRGRWIDSDGLYSKAAIDGLREGGILVDDSPRYVAGVEYSQEISKNEETVIELWQIG